MGRGVLEVIAGPMIGAITALAGVAVSQRMQRTTQEQSRHHDEVRNLAADLLSLSERLWRSGWALSNASIQEMQARERQDVETSAVENLQAKRLLAMQAESDLHLETLSAQRRLMLTSPALDGATEELVRISRLWPPPLERPGQDAYSRRDKAERAFVDSVRKELGTLKK